MSFLLTDDKISSIVIDESSSSAVESFKKVKYPILPGYKWLFGREIATSLRSKIVAEFVFDVCKLNNVIENESLKDTSAQERIVVDDIIIYLLNKYFGINCSLEAKDKNYFSRLFYVLKRQHFSDTLSEAIIERKGVKYQIMFDIVRMPRKKGGNNVLVSLLNARKLDDEETAE